MWCNGRREMLFNNGEKIKQKIAINPFLDICKWIFFFSTLLLYILINIFINQKKKTWNINLWKKEKYVNGDILANILFLFWAKENASHIHF